jgi:hypothetical protein
MIRRSTRTGDALPRTCGASGVRGAACVALVALLAAGAGQAQTEDKPRTQVAEPQRKETSHLVSLVIVEYDLADKHRDGFPQAIPELVRFVGQQDRLQLQVQVRNRRLSDPAIAGATLLYMTGWDAAFRLNEADKAGLAKYLRDGGLLFAEDIRQSDPSTGLDGSGVGTVGTPFDRQLKALLRDPKVLGSEGDGWQKIPKKHPLYSAFFAFPDGPPLGAAPGGNVLDLEMLQLRGRVAVVFSDLNISYYWGNPLADARERGLQFGANLLVYALTQHVARP